MGKALLMDVLKLQYIYSDEDFKAVISLLKNKNQDPMLIEVLELARGMDEPKLTTSKSKKGASQSSPDSLVESFRDKDPTIYKCLREAEAILTSRKEFPTVKELREYLAQSSIKISGKKPKAELITTYLERLSQLSDHDLEMEVKQLRERGNSVKKENSFMRMANKMIEAKR